MKMNQNNILIYKVSILCTSHKCLNESRVWQLFVARLALVYCIKFVDNRANLND